MEFDKAFRQLFGGGRGRLELQEDEDILEAGVRIISQPPGKKLQNMMQLSGGEKALTAIALLFAIQNLKPSPFCLLDEIEAALDDSNVTRFAKYLHKLTKNTQFIIITHRRGDDDRGGPALRHYHAGEGRVHAGFRQSDRGRIGQIGGGRAWEKRKWVFPTAGPGLSKTRNSIVSGIDSIFSGFSSIDEDFYEEIEEILVMGDIGINTTTRIISNLKMEVSERHIKEPSECKQLLIDSIKNQMAVGETAYEFENRKSVVLVIGVTEWERPPLWQAGRQAEGAGEKGDPGGG